MTLKHPEPIAYGIERSRLLVTLARFENDLQCDNMFFYDEKDYTCSHSVSQDTRELSMITFETRDGYDVVALNLGLRCSRTPGHMDMTVYCPYWMVNKTGLRLAYKVSFWRQSA
ncbi:unnamed protein product [Dibothriocephalus latus]|uniref:Vacuolar protein sorting-associated protein 13 VPS13 adaptor binding domain-containing protein n=1 Tax=Dibothriocephalus latus TaxID=60516 RepID=A0A3P7MYH2_DIBLA|nr:unnamed protein product [Dibothriocephalus latus]